MHRECDSCDDDQSKSQLSLRVERHLLSHRTESPNPTNVDCIASQRLILCKVIESQRKPFVIELQSSLRTSVILKVESHPSVIEVHQHIDRIACKL